MFPTIPPSHSVMSPTRPTISPPTPAPSPQPDLHHAALRSAPAPSSSLSAAAVAAVASAPTPPPAVSSPSSPTAPSPTSAAAHLSLVFPALDPRSRMDLLTELVGMCSARELAQLNAIIAPRLKVDFLGQLPIEVSLHILSFIDDPKTLARASGVSRFWRSLVNDEHTWKAMCGKYRYRRGSIASGVHAGAIMPPMLSSTAPSGDPADPALLASLYRRYRARGLDPSNALHELRTLHDLFLAKQGGGPPTDMSTADRAFYAQLEEILQEETRERYGEGGSTEMTIDTSDPSCSAGVAAATAAADDDPFESTPLAPPLAALSPSAPAPSSSNLGWLGAGSSSAARRASDLGGALGLSNASAAAQGLLSSNIMPAVSSFAAPSAQALWFRTTQLTRRLAAAVAPREEDEEDDEDVAGERRFDDDDDDDDVGRSTVNAPVLGSRKAARRSRRRSAPGGPQDARATAGPASSHAPSTLGKGRPPRFIVENRSATFASSTMPGGTFSYKTHFKMAYLTESAWLRGGRLLTQHTSQDHEAIVTSLAISAEWIIVGMANSKIHVIDAESGLFVQTLAAHQSGVWALALVNGAGRGAPSASFSRKGKARDDGAPADETLEWFHRARRAMLAGGGVARSFADGDSEMEDLTRSEPRRRPSKGDAPTLADLGLDLGGPSSSAGFGPTEGGGASPRLSSSSPCGSARGFGNEDAIVISGGCDRDVRVWDIRTGTCKYVLKGHTSTVRCLKVIEGRPLAVSGSRDGTLRVWNVETGKLVHALVGHQHAVRCLDVAGNRVASASYDCTARIWDVDTGECLHVLTGHYHQIYAVAFDGRRLATGSLDSTVRVWDAENGQCLALFQAHTSLVGHLQLTDSVLVTGGSDGRVIVFSLETFDCLHRLWAHDNSVTCLQFDERWIVTGGNDGKVKLWDFGTGAFIRELCAPSEVVWKVSFCEDKVVVLCRRDGKTCMDVISFRPAPSEM